MRTLPKDLRLVRGKGDGMHTACLMSVQALLDGRPPSDDHPSVTLRAFGIEMNDGYWWDSPEERTAVLLPIAKDERLCASKCDATLPAERRRAYLCADWAVRTIGPLGLRNAGLEAQALQLESLSEVVDEETARTAMKVARSIADSTQGLSKRITKSAAGAAGWACESEYWKRKAYGNVAEAAVLAALEASAHSIEEQVRFRGMTVEFFQRLLDVRSPE